MKGILFMFGMIVIMMMSTNGQKDLAQLRFATAQFQSLEAARATGYGLLIGHNQCFQDSAFGALGYRYIDIALLDANLDIQQPEAMVYAPGPQGGLQLVAVEYIVPVADWHAKHTGWPQLMGHQFHLNSSLNAYVLNVWAWEGNPSGMFEDWNSNVSCA